jgi:CRP/FNR family transcriptional regulator
MIRTISPNRASFGRCSACAVRSLSICGALDQADLAEFERIARQVQFAPNEALFTAGQVASAVHSLTAGVARLYKLLPDGRRQVIGFALPGDFLGTAPFDRYSFSADAIDSVTVCRLSKEAFTHFIERRPHFLIRINEFAARELNIADYLGLTIETVSRTLTRFEREKMLIIVAGGVRLLDASRAAAMAAA